MKGCSFITKEIPAYVGNYTKNRARYGKISEITVHHAAGIVSADALGQLWQKKGRAGSSHYGVSGAQIGQYVSEDDIAWTNSNWSANCRAVTIEVSNSSGAPSWEVSDTSLQTLVKLVADIARRNGLFPLVVGKTLTYHSMYTATACPGPYLKSKLQWLCDEANKLANMPEDSTSSDKLTTLRIGPASAGDVLTLAGVRDEYDGVPQIGGTAYYISHEEGQGGGEPEELKEASIEEFLNADPSDGIWYKLTGKVDDIYSTEYGNFWLLDESDNSIKVRVYGLTATRQDSNDKSFSSIGINEGDIITIATLRAEHNGEAQAGGTPPAYIIEGGSGGDEPDDPTIKKVSVDEFLKASVSGSVWYQLTGEITDLYNTSYGNFTLVDGTGSVLVYGLTKEKVSSNDQSFPELGLKEGDIVTLVGTRDEYNGKAQVGGPAYYISHEEGETPDVPEGDPTALIISEYVEGSSFNKYIEIANISDKTVDLASYSLVLYSNGNTSPQTTVALKGTLEPGAVKVYNGEDAALALPAGVESELNLAVNFNGDDAIVLTCNGENADVVGYIGEKIEWGKDKTFRRKTTVTAPTTEFNIDEWEQSSKDDVSGLGSF